MCAADLSRCLRKLGYGRMQVDSSLRCQCSTMNSSLLRCRLSDPELTFSGTPSHHVALCIGPCVSIVSPEKQLWHLPLTLRLWHGCAQMFGLPHFASNYCFLSFSTAVSAWALATKLAGVSSPSQSVRATC